MPVVALSVNTRDLKAGVGRLVRKELATRGFSGGTETSLKAAE